jgi:RimJ/RimL family protein N-acetyltransferase
VTTRRPSFDLQPRLDGSLVTLRPLLEADFDALRAIAADPLIWEQHPESDRYQDAPFQRFFQGALDSKGALITLDAADGKVIGSSRYFGLDTPRSEVEIGWTFLARSHWGGRFNGEMKQLMLRHAFQYIDSVIFLIGPENIRSQRAVERIGATRDGTRIDGEGRMSLVYRRMKDEG